MNTTTDPQANVECLVLKKVEPRVWWISLLDWTGIRDRLRCPSCKAVGTYKPHPPTRGGRPLRWLCKCCGFYKGPEGKGRMCYPSSATKVWEFMGVMAEDTPLDMLRDSGVWPWKG